MLSFTAREHVNMVDFPAFAGENCNFCKFQAVCAAITEQFGEI
jgi:hypothetical protein